MPRFRFRLERVLAIRKRQEEREKLAFAAATQRKLAAEKALEDVHRRQRKAAEHAARLMGSRPTIRDLVDSYHYRVGLLRRESEASTVLAIETQNTEQARLKLVEAMKRRRVLEMLREKRHAEWQYAEENAQQIELDETGLAAFLRHEDRSGETMLEERIA